MTKPFEHAGRSYAFTRHRGTVTVTRDDGAQPWSTYPTYKPTASANLLAWLQSYHVHQPALATIAETKHLIVHNHTDHGTFVHQIVWARTADDARRMREEADNANQ